ncbi:putative O-methyltransferase YrrM [Clostridium acetobutylicum]|uniref:tRNA 5-hydroxyuridine methyltransferase n=1 Tax=Clostridium acetobutylicum (strain ATCC 824 / DSM 792 / JCM 1419 / IAM 19013 / LMG 5710 / NBRC 13948 / NRRL B-527 / VKM B-1787 / 2291 / W) TaxID=272562 RepID=Q97IF5_CLOAB|nr:MULTISPECIES: O-methyltransferase [Clostridium]AAK79652.1 S-adenosylmethionine-dependent methyltransferase [Clostridium acetobutylicum ATCC 824]ADZ20736.1 S-adenosylmethionine-dependent methyltransferase [Clostridium acetobutylicum EA 2018]AEI33999.1 S-adenosylmethionine-dependent methyltransferase [Clostridium acetobutylicum DSM 1731]AWV79912.1 O-methyltransferase [Clostridium acetobutylicum]KHD37983.1 methyltransferase [Clostridium acetobutylicum]
MGKIMYDYISDYIRNLIPEHEGVLKELEEYAAENNVPIVHKETAKFLEFMMQVKKPLKILELGTAIGYSASLMALNSNAHITTVDRSDKMIEIALENIKKFGLDDRIEVLNGECIDVIKSLNDKYDVIFIDAGKGHYEDFFNESLRILKDDGIIIADNVLFRGMVASNDLLERRKITIVKRMRRYLDVVSNRPDFTTSVIPMGDGIAVTTRRKSNE